MAEIDKLKFVGVMIKGEKYHVLCSTKNSDEKIYQYLSTPNDRSDTKPAGGTGDAESEDVSDPGPMGGTGGTHSGLTMDTSWNLGYIYAGLACLEIQSDNDKVRALIWDKKIYRAFYWSASNKFLFCARPDSATVDKVGDPVNGSRLTSFHNWYTVSGENGKPFFEIMVDPQERTLFGLQENGEASSLLWGELQQPHATRAIPDGGGGAGVDFGLTRWLAMASAANASYVLGTPEGRSGVVKRFNIDKAVPTADISIPAEWKPRGKPVVTTSGGKQYCCMTAQGEKGAWGIVVADIGDFTTNKAKIIKLPDAYTVAPLAANPQSGTLYAICMESSSAGKTLIQAVSADASKPEAAPVVAATWHSSHDLYSGDPEHLWCYFW